MNCRFFHISINPSTGRVQFTKAKEAWWANPKSKQWWPFYSISDIVHVNYMSEGQTINQVCYKILTTFHEWVRWRKRRREECGRTAHGFFTKIMHWYTMHCLSSFYWQSTRSPQWNIHCTHLTYPHMTFLFLKIKPKKKQ